MYLVLISQLVSNIKKKRKKKTKKAGGGGEGVFMTTKKQLIYCVLCSIVLGSNKPFAKPD